MTVETTSEAGIAFIQGHEGNPLQAYLCPAGKPTIGTGATNASRVATAYLKSIGVPGGKIVPGKTKITAEQSAEMFRLMLRDEYEIPVRAGMPANAEQHQFDAATSGTYNLGAGFMGWKWANLWRAGDIKGAAAYLATHYNTAGGRKLAGLVRRRKEEAALFEHGVYAGVAPGAAREITREPPKHPDPVVEEAQKLLTARGFNPGAIDGWLGAKTKAAVIEYQRAHPHLTNDGIIGPATMAQLRRDAAAAKDALGGGGTGAAATVLAFFAGLPWGVIALFCALALAGWLAFRYRDVILRRFNTLTGREVG